MAQAKMTKAAAMQRLFAHARIECAGFSKPPPSATRPQLLSALPLLNKRFHVKSPSDISGHNGEQKRYRVAQTVAQSKPLRFVFRSFPAPAAKPHRPLPPRDRAIAILALALASLYWFAPAQLLVGDEIDALGMLDANGNPTSYVRAAIMPDPLPAPAR